MHLAPLPQWIATAGLLYLDDLGTKLSHRVVQRTVRRSTFQIQQLEHLLGVHSRSALLDDFVCRTLPGCGPFVQYQFANARSRVTNGSGRTLSAQADIICLG